MHVLHVFNEPVTRSNYSFWHASSFVLNFPTIKTTKILEDIPHLLA